MGSVPISFTYLLGQRLQVFLEFLEIAHGNRPSNFLILLCYQINRFFRYDKWFKGQLVFAIRQKGKTMSSTPIRRRFDIWLVLPAIFILVISIALPLAYYHFSIRSATLLIQATVLHRQELKILYQMPTIAVTESDIQKGCLDISSATQISVYDNDKSGYALLFEGLSWPFNSALVHGLDRELQVSLPSALIHQPYSKSPVTETLSYHFNLAGDVMPGVYRWPISISLPSTP
jgi:hypothetical protein